MKSKEKAQIKLWIEIAENDLTASSILYESKEYRNSYYLFHQAVEKANKAFALFGGKTEEELFKYGHQQLKIFNDPIKEKKKQMDGFNELLDTFPQIKNHEFTRLFSFSDYNSSLQQAIDHLTNLHSADLVNISLDDIRYLLDELYEIEDSKIMLPKKTDVKFVEIMHVLADWIRCLDTSEARAFHIEYTNFTANKKNLEILCSLMKEAFKTTISLSFVAFTFFVCAILTTQHGTLTRYPVKGKNPLKIYTKRLPVIREQREIMDVFDRGLTKFKRIVNAASEK